MPPQSTAQHDYHVFMNELERIHEGRCEIEPRMILGRKDDVGGTTGNGGVLATLRLRQTENAIGNVMHSITYNRNTSLRDECDRILSIARDEATRIRGIPPGIGLTIVRLELAIRDFITKFLTNLVECNWGAQ